MNASRKASYYCIGRVNGQGPNLWMLRFWRPDGSFGSCQCVEEDKLSAEIGALRAMGWIVTRD